MRISAFTKIIVTVAVTAWVFILPVKAVATILVFELALLLSIKRDRMTMAAIGGLAVFTGLIAKENVVNTFGVLFGVGAEVAEDDPSLWAAVASHYTPLAAYSFMIFNLLCAPCFAAMGAIKREMNNTKWTLAAIGYMCGFAYAVSLIVYQLGGLLLGEVAPGAGTVAAGIALAALVYLAVRRGYRPEAGERLNLRSVANA